MKKDNNSKLRILVIKMKKYIYPLIIFLLLSTSVFAAKNTNILDTALNNNIDSKANTLLNSTPTSNTEIYLNQEGKFFGIIKEEKFGIIFDNDESLVITLEPIEDKTSLGIKQTISKNKEKYSKKLCIEKYGACEYTREGYKEIEKTKIGFSQKVKNFFYKIFTFFSSPTKKVEEDFNKISKKMNPKEKEKLQGDIWIDFFDYRENKGKEGYGKKKTEEISENIFKLITNADSLKNIMELRALIDEYCYEENKGKGYESPKCQVLRAKLKEKGDELKEKLFAEIDENKKDGLAKLMKLRCILMAQEKASKGTSFAKGETDEWFSTENVTKINKKIREKAKKWWKKHLEEDSTIKDIFQWRILALAHETATGEYEDSSSVFGKYGEQLGEDVKKKAAGLVAANLIEIDICNPDLDKLAKLMDKLIYKDDKGNPVYDDSCQLILPKSACDVLKNKDFQEAYSILFYKAGLGNDNPNSLPVPPIDCEKDKDFPNQETGINKDKEVQSTVEEELDTEIIKDTGTGTTTTTEVICELLIFEDEVIGWDYSVENCTKNYNEGLVCWEQCGFDPPLVVKERETNECYETAGGYIHEDLIIPCSPRPIPMEGIEECVKECLKEVNRNDR
jgi:hypothetical protein